MTGCSGFLAGKIIDMLLARGIAVRGCDIAPTSRTDIEFVKADLRNLDGSLIILHNPITFVGNLISVLF